MELEPAANISLPPVDRRPPMPEPPPVRLVAVADVRAVASANIKELDRRLDSFYIAMLRFEREDETKDSIIYRGQNFRLILNLIDPPSGQAVDRDDLRPIAVEVESLAHVEQQLVEREIEYQWQRGLTVGSSSILCQDPANNWINITESRGVR